MPKTAARKTSPSLARREREKAETRKLILEAARTMFAREGYEATTMRGIANRIGYTATAIYHHFADKNALMLELCTLDFRALAAALFSIGRIADPVERIAQMGRAYVRFAEDHPEQFRFMFMTARPAVGPDLKDMDPSEDGFAFLRQAVQEAIAAGRFRDEFNDPDLVAQILWACVHGLATIHLHKSDFPETHSPLRDASVIVGDACDAAMRGLLRST